MRVCIAFCSGLLVVLSSTRSEAQIDLSGMLDVAYKRDIGKEEGEADSQVNSIIKGASPFNLVRARFFADAEISPSIAVVATLLYDQGLGHVEMEGGYIFFEHIRQRRGLNARVGKFATPFGAFAARSFGLLNPLIGTPLIYHYFSAVRGASVLRDNADQLSRRDAPNYSGRGQPTLYDACWNTGLQLFGSFGPVTYALAMT